LDLMFGQTTESLAGNPANEPRPAPYRNISQAYGTYVFPVGKGLKGLSVNNCINFWKADCSSNRRESGLSRVGVRLFGDRKP
jgi:hypothetical protein